MIATATVVVPLYNKEAYVARAMCSVLRQTLGNIEIIVVDDGSSDQGPEIVRSFCDPRVKLIEQANSGPGAARNRGLVEATGDFIAFLDADDEWEPEFLEEAVALLNAHSSAASVTFSYVEHPSQKSQDDNWRRRGLDDGLLRICPTTSPDIVVAMIAFMSPCTTVCRTEVLRRFGGFYQKQRCTYGEDANLWIKVLFNEAVVISMRTLVHIHFEASELSKNLSGSRPVEPFLNDSSEVMRACPTGLHSLLKQFLARRALKTSCVLGYWGLWRDARTLKRRYTSIHDWRLPYYAAATVCSTPIGSLAGRLVRRFKCLR